MLKDCYPLGDNHEKEQGEKKEEKQSKRKIMTIISVEEYAVRVCQLFSHLKKKKKKTRPRTAFSQRGFKFEGGKKKAESTGFY